MVRTHKKTGQDLDRDLQRVLGDDPPLGGDIGVWREFGEALRGVHGPWVRFMSVTAFLFLVALVYCAIRFFTADQVEGLVFWGLCGMFCVIARVAIKVWVWMEFNRNSVLREVKRMELQMARLHGMA